MSDHEAVAAIVAGDGAGLAVAYDRYTPGLYGYCRTLLPDPQDAADAVQDTFVIAAARVSALRDPDKLRAWLYAVARNESHRKLRSRETSAEFDEADAEFTAMPTVPPGQATGPPGQPTQPGQTVPAAQQAELRELTQAALSGMKPQDREVIELSLRHNLEGGELAAVLGISRNRAQAGASRARRQLEKSLGALLVARTGRRSCADLDEILAGWDGQLTALPRNRVIRHIEHCAICGERERRALRPAMLHGFPPIVPLPPRLRYQVMALCSDDSPDAMEFKRDVARDAGRFDPDGFPRPLVRAGRRRLSEPGSALVAAASVAAAALVIIAMIALRGSPPLHTLDDNKTSGGAGSTAATSVATVPTPTALISTAPATMPPSTAAGIAPGGASTSAAPTGKPKKSHPAPPPKQSPSPSSTPAPTHPVITSPTQSPSSSPSASPSSSPSPTPPTPSPSPTPPPTTTSPPDPA
jgi:RNA polymerase sigma factor (sigma-70 family)